MNSVVSTIQHGLKCVVAAYMCSYYKETVRNDQIWLLGHRFSHLWWRLRTTDIKVQLHLMFGAVSL